MSILDIVLALIGSGLVLILVFILAKRRLIGRFPVFFAYCLWTLLVSAGRILVGSRPMSYFLAYWLTEVTYLILALLTMLLVLGPFTAVIYERRRGSQFVIPAGLVLVVACSISLALFRPLSPRPLDRFASAVYLFVILMSLLEVAVFAAALVIRRRYSIDWSRYEFGILAGFGMLALLTLAANLATLLFLLHLSVPLPILALYRYFSPGAFVGSAIVWLIAFWRPEPPTTYEPPDPRKYRELASVMKNRVEVFKELLKRFGLHLAAAVASPW